MECYRRHFSIWLRVFTTKSPSSLFQVTILPYIHAQSERKQTVLSGCSAVSSSASPDCRGGSTLWETKRISKLMGGVDSIVRDDQVSWVNFLHLSTVISVWQCTVWGANADLLSILYLASNIIFFFGWQIKSSDFDMIILQSTTKALQ